MTFGDPTQRQRWVRAAFDTECLLDGKDWQGRIVSAFCSPSGMWSVLCLRSKGVIWGQL